jgi:hypothetical protein
MTFHVIANPRTASHEKRRAQAQAQHAHRFNEITAD